MRLKMLPWKMWSIFSERKKLELKKISGWINKYNVIIIWPSNPSSGAFKLKKTQVKMQERTRTRYLNYCQGNERGHKGQDNICVFSFACLHVCLSAYLSIYFRQLIYSFASMFFYFFFTCFLCMPICQTVYFCLFVCFYYFAFPFLSFLLIYVDICWLTSLSFSLFFISFS